MKGRSKEIERFVREYLEREQYVTVLDAEFVFAFALRFSCTVYPNAYGAWRVPLAGRSLSRLHGEGILTRWITGVSAYEGGKGFPKWVYSYSLKGQEDNANKDASV